MKIKENKGITLYVLIIIVLILLIISGISISIGIGSIQNTRLRGFYTRLEIIQKRVDEIVSTNENYIDKDTGDRVYLTQTGQELTQQQQNFLSNNFNYSQEEIEKFSYFTSDDLQEKLEILNIGENVFINFEDKLVISENGVEIGNNSYYTLENTNLYIKNNSEKNVGTISEVDYTVIEYGPSKYKVTASTKNQIGDLGGGGTLKYKATTSKYWITADNFEMIMEDGINYDILFKDLNNNTFQDIVTIEINNARLPQEYQEVEYLESTGTQYIDTKIYSNSSLSIDLTLQLLNEIKDQKFLGSYGGGGVCLGTLGSKWRIGRGTWENNTLSVTLNKTNIKISGTTWKINDDIITFSNYAISSNNNAPILLFAVNYCGRLFQKDAIKVYNLNIKDGEELILNFIPCYRKSDNKPGMYDTVNGAFYTNSGTGEFLTGDPIIYEGITVNSVNNN